MPGTRRARSAEGGPIRSQRHEPATRDEEPDRRRRARSPGRVRPGAQGLLLPASGWSRDDTPPDVAALSQPRHPGRRRGPLLQAPVQGQVRPLPRQVDGTGKGDSAGDQKVPPANFTDAAYMSGRSDGQLYYQILACGGGEACAMPAFGPGTDHSWTKDKIWHMVAYVRRFAATK